MGRCAPDPGRCWLGGGIQCAFFQAVAAVAISRRPIAPAGSGPPVRPSSPGKLGNNNNLHWAFKRINRGVGIAFPNLGEYGFSG